VISGFRTLSYDFFVGETHREGLYILANDSCEMCVELVKKLPNASPYPTIVEIQNWEKEPLKKFIPEIKGIPAILLFYKDKLITLAHGNMPGCELLEFIYNAKDFTARAENGEFGEF